MYFRSFLSVFYDIMSFIYKDINKADGNSDWGTVKDLLVKSEE